MHACSLLSTRVPLDFFGVNYGATWLLSGLGAARENSAHYPQGWNWSSLKTPLTVLIHWSNAGLTKDVLFICMVNLIRQVEILRDDNKNNNAYLMGFLIHFSENLTLQTWRNVWLVSYFIRRWSAELNMYTPRTSSTEISNQITSSWASVATVIR